MQTIQKKRNNGLNALALTLVLPTLYFMIISVLKFELNVNGPYDAITPFLESTGIKESFGWNINLLILLGPVFAAFIAAWQTIHMAWQFSREQFQFQFTIRKKSFALFILFLSGLVLASLLIYLVLENIIIRE